MHKKKFMLEYDVIVVGAGASGLLAAGRASQLGAKTLLIEKMQKVGLKLFITGKGRCNITTSEEKDFFIQQVEPNGNFLRNSISQFYNQDILQILEEQKVTAVLERGNRYYPSSGKASDVVKALTNYATQNGAEIVCEEKVEQLLTENNKIVGVQTDKRKLLANNLIIATGGNSYPNTGSTGDGYALAKQVGHNITKIRPALIPLETEQKIPAKWHKLLLKNTNVTLYSDQKKIAEAFGEMQFMSFGVSGSIIFSVSRKAIPELEKNKKLTISIDLKPALDNKKLDNRLLREIEANGKGIFKDILKSLLPIAMIDGFAELTDISLNKKCAEINGEERKRIVQSLKNMQFTISKTRPMSEAIVTAGGIDTNEVNPKTMESKLIKGLFFSGEVLDLDAPTGGYNLQIAFTTGWVAGNSVLI